MYICDDCNYKTEYSSNFCIHKKSKKHLKIIEEKSNKNVKVHINSTSSTQVVHTEYTTNVHQNYSSISKEYICENCQFQTKHKTSYYRHIKNCKRKNNDIKNILEHEMIKKDMENLKKENEMLKNFMENANNIINNAQNNTKVTAEAMKSVSMSALKYANDKFKNTPALLPLENFNINDLDFNNEKDKKQLVEILIYNSKQKSLDKLLGDHIIKNYKKDNPEEQSFHTTDCSRLNYIVRNLIQNALSWSVDKNGIKICSSIIKPLIKKCIDILLEHQKNLLQEMGCGNYNKQKDVELIIDVLMSIDSGSLETDINRYIAPYFNLSKNLE